MIRSIKMSVEINFSLITNPASLALISGGHHCHDYVSEDQQMRSGIETTYDWTEDLKTSIFYFRWKKGKKVTFGGHLWPSMMLSAIFYMSHHQKSQNGTAMADFLLFMEMAVTQHVWQQVQTEDWPKHFGVKFLLQVFILNAIAMEVFFLLFLVMASL